MARQKTKRRKIFTDMLNCDEWCKECGLGIDDKKFIAWAELPEPYKGE